MLRTDWSQRIKEKRVTDSSQVSASGNQRTMLPYLWGISGRDGEDSGVGLNILSVKVATQQKGDVTQVVLNMD